jgi:hypothetical protein
MIKTLAPCVLRLARLGFVLSPVPAQNPTVGRHAQWRPPLPKRVLLLLAALAVGFGVVLSVAAQEATAPHWVGTWESSPQPIWGPDFIAPLKYPRNLWNQTVRQVSRVSIGGPRLRVVLSNEYGERPVTIGDTHVALAGQGPAIMTGSDRALTFGGSTTVTIPPGAPILSDPIELAVAPLASVAISLFLPEVTPVTTWHNDRVRRPSSWRATKSARPTSSRTRWSPRGCSSARSWSRHPRARERS